MADRLIAESDIRRMIAAQPDARGRAMLAVLYETGLREQELCALNLGSVEFVDKWGHITIPKGAPGLKTGSRRILVVDSVRYLHAWMEEHPFRNDPSKPLFLSMSRRRPQVRFSPNAVYVFCIRAGEKAHTKMRTNPPPVPPQCGHREGSSGLERGADAPLLWLDRNSDMPARYVHLASQDYEKMELSRRQLLADGTKPEPALRPIKCKPCGAANSPTAKMAEQVKAALKQAIDRQAFVVESGSKGTLIPSS